MSDKIADKYHVLGKELNCQVCENDTFWQTEAQLNTVVASLLNIDWVNPTGICVVCSRCGYIHWFFPR